MAKIGRPLTYKTAEEMQSVIDQYFIDCEGKPLLDDKGNVLTDKYGKPAIVSTPPTITGLALALGFTSRLALLNYQGRKEFVNTVTRAKARVEAYAETRLFDNNGANGAKFSLANNFKDWREKQDVSLEHSGNMQIRVQVDE